MTIRLLIVDPDRALLECYCAFFDHVGLETTTVAQGHSAGNLFLQRTHDAVMLEPDLPEGGCQLLLQTIAVHTQQRPLPVVVVSRRATFEFEYPVHRYHIKPVSMTVLLHDIFKIVESRESS